MNFNPSDKGAESGEFLGFHEALRNTINNYNGAYKDIVMYCPSLFELLCEILNDRTTDWNTKLMIDAALAYFVLPKDIVPDREEAGYVDDLFIVCHVLKEIKEKVSPELLETNWHGAENILQLIDNLYERSNKIVATNALNILRKVGLQKYQSLDLTDTSGAYPQKLVKLAEEKRELLGLLAYLVRIVYRVNMRNAKTEQLREFLEHQGDYDEINRLIELSKKTISYNAPEKKTPNRNNNPPVGIEDIESRLRAARLNALVKDSTDDED